MLLGAGPYGQDCRCACGYTRSDCIPGEIFDKIEDALRLHERFDPKFEISF